MNKRLVWHDREILDVIDLLLTCKDREEIKNIFDRILTPREINDIGRRYKVLQMIDRGASYADIKIETSMSATAISRLSAKCGFGFRKSSGMVGRKPKKQTQYQNKTRTLKYKGVKIQ